MPIKENIEAIRGRIRSACERRGRAVEEITVVAVTKNTYPDKIAECVATGIRDIAENRVQEAEKKFPLIPGTGMSMVRKHLIGHLQTNKAKKAVELFDVIQSVDSEYLAEEISKQAGKVGKTQECYVELKVSEEDSKFGLDPAVLNDFMNHIRVFGNIRITGIMGMAPFFDNPEDARPYFKKLKKYFDDCREYNPGIAQLSMGMSNDFEIAVEEGATVLRIGTAIFKGSD